MSDRQRLRSPRRSAILCAAVLSCALLAPSAAALESDPPPHPPATVEAGSIGAETGRRAAAPTGAARSVRPRGAAAPVELRPRPEPAPVQERTSSASGSSRDGGSAADGNRRERDEKQETPPRVWPLEKGDYTFTQPFGCVPQLGGFYRTNPGCPADSPAVHGGIDLAAPEGTRIYAAASGWVTEAGLDREVGLANTRLVIQHDGANEGYATEYLHWIASYVRVGDYVRAGEPIAEVGSVGWSTGPHLHFAVIEFASGDYADPVRWLPKSTDGGAYRGLAPGRRPLRYDPVSANMPEHADPAPPPAPKRAQVPDSPPDDAQGKAPGKSSEDRDKRQRKAERRDRARAERAEARATADAGTAETGDAGRRGADASDAPASNRPADAENPGTADSGDATDSGANEERKRDRGADHDPGRDGKKQDGKNRKDHGNDPDKDRGGDSGRGDGKHRDGGKDKPDRTKDKDAGKGNGGGQTNGKGDRGTGHDGSAGKNRDEDATGEAASTAPAADPVETPPVAAADEGADRAPASETTPAAGADSGSDASGQAATASDEAVGETGGSEQQIRQRRTERRAAAEPAA